MSDERIWIDRFGMTWKESNVPTDVEYIRADIVQQFVDAIDKHTARIAELEAAQRWIPVTERLPDANGFVLCFGTSGFIVGYFKRFEYPPHEGKPFFTGHNTGRVTHWMALPPAPKGEDDE